jgi:uncharacterized membrane protein YqaE (UPF0057 family)
MTEQSNVCLYLLAVFLPPLAVFLDTGCSADFLINILLSILGWIPGVIREWILDGIGMLECMLIDVFRCLVDYLKARSCQVHVEIGRMRCGSYGVLVIFVKVGLTTGGLFFPSYTTMRVQFAYRNKIICFHYMSIFCYRFIPKLQLQVRTRPK